MRIVLTERQFKRLYKDMVTENSLTEKRYPVNTNDVLMVKKYLDENFIKGCSPALGEDGEPIQNIVITMIAKDEDGNPITDKKGNPSALKTFYNMEDFTDKLIHKFQNLYLDHNKRDKFLSAVAKHWFNNKITPYGGLTVNYIS